MAAMSASVTITTAACFHGRQRRRHPVSMRKSVPEMSCREAAANAAAAQAGAGDVHGIGPVLLAGLDIDDRIEERPAHAWAGHAQTSFSEPPVAAALFGQVALHDEVLDGRLRNRHRRGFFKCRGIDVLMPSMTVISSVRRCAQWPPGDRARGQ